VSERSPQAIAAWLKSNLGEPIGGTDEPGRVHLEGTAASPPLRLRDDPVGQHTGEQEVRQDNDPVVSQGFCAREPFGDARLREADEGRLDGADPAALEQQPGRLGHLGVRVRVGGTTTHEHDRCLRPQPLVHHGGQPVGEVGEQERVRPQRPAVAERQPGVPQPLALQGRRDVALAVPRSHQHQRYDVDAAVTLGDEGGDSVLDGRR